MENEHMAVAPDQTPILGRLYEAYVASLLQQHHWIVRPTASGADQGADLLLYRSPDAKYPAYAVQCKGWIHGPVGNEAVQAVFAAKAFYEAERALLVAFQGFTPSAKTLAEKISVQLVVAGDRAWLEPMAWPDPTPAALSHEAARDLVLTAVRSAVDRQYPLPRTGWEEWTGHHPPDWTVAVSRDRIESSTGTPHWIWDVEASRPAWRGRPGQSLLLRVTLDPFAGTVLGIDGLGPAGRVGDE